MNVTSKFVLMIAAVASLTIALTIQEQDVSAFNDKNNIFVFNSHSHTSCKTGECTGNDGRVLNDENTHSNDNFNSNRPEPQKHFLTTNLITTSNSLSILIFFLSSFDKIKRILT